MVVLYKQFARARTVFCLLAAFVLISPALAANDIYTVEGVEVDVTAKNAVAAREKALEEAQIKAYQMLAEKILSPQELESFQVPDINTVSMLVQDFEVTNEQLSSVRYKGTYTVRFRPNAMRSQMVAQGTDYTDTPQPPLLVLPFYQSGQATVLWDSSNPWMAAWVKSKAGSQDELQPVKVPMGDILDVSQIREDQALTYNPAMLKAMLARYQAEEAVIALASPGTGPDSGVVVSLYETTTGMPKFASTISVQPAPGETTDALFGRAVMEIKRSLRGQWKQVPVTYSPQTYPDTYPAYPPQAGRVPVAVPSGPSQVFGARVHFNSVQEWVRIKNTLERLPGMQSVMVQSLRPRQANVQLNYAGDSARLAMALQQAGVNPQASPSVYPSVAGEAMYDLYPGVMAR